MDINNARIILAEAQACFQDLGLPLVNEFEKLNSGCFSNYLQFRSWLSKDGELFEILTYLYIDHDIIELSINFHRDFEESITRRLLEFINGMNFHCTDGYWIFYLEENKFKYRFAQIINEKSFDKNPFKMVIEEFLENGLYDYSYIKRIMQKDEDLDLLLNEWLNPISINEMNQ